MWRLGIGRHREIALQLSILSSLICRDREIAPTKSRQGSWVFFSSIPCYFFIEKTTAEAVSVGLQLVFNHFNIYFLIVLRVPRAHATSAFTDLKVSVYGGCHEPTPRLRLREKGGNLQEKGDSLQEKGCRFMGEKV